VVEGEEIPSVAKMSGAPQPMVVVEKLTLAYRDLYDINPRIVQQFGPTVKELDLSNNNIKELTALKGFPVLETLVLDHNEVTSHTKFPLMPKLHTLWVNSNKISNLILFIDKLASSTPHLKFLSMLKNEACPNFFNGKSLQDYNDYRRYVICRLPSLTCLDATQVSEQERTEAARLYSSLPLPSKPAAPTDDLRAVVVKKSAKPSGSKHKGKKKSTKKATTTAASGLPEFSSSDGPTGPPPTIAGGEDGGSSDFSSDDDSGDWTDEEVEEDNEVILDTHLPAPMKR